MRLVDQLRRADGGAVKRYQAVDQPLDDRLPPQVFADLLPVRQLDAVDPQHAAVVDALAPQGDAVVDHVIEPRHAHVWAHLGDQIGQGRLHQPAVQHEQPLELVAGDRIGAHRRRRVLPVDQHHRDGAAVEPAPLDRVVDPVPQRHALEAGGQLVPVARVEVSVQIHAGARHVVRDHVHGLADDPAGPVHRLQLHAVTADEVEAVAILRGLVVGAQADARFEVLEAVTADPALGARGRGHIGLVRTL
ncbi:hypothetical protein D9M68_628510 [compost metagenome]